METTIIDGKTLQNMFISGVNKLSANRQEIDALNVFPVPDGDTGTNMSLTAISAANAVLSLVEPYHCSDVMKCVSDGSLRGARGNSGVILSQLFRGMYKAINEHEEIGVMQLAEAFNKASATAYKAVMKPKEGTVLTVAKEVAKKAEEMAFETDDIDLMLQSVIEHADFAVNQTTEMLKVLKDAGVVDAGGKGYMYFIQGFYEGLHTKVAPDFEQDNAPAGAMPAAGVVQNIRYGYCTEFFIDLKSPNEAFASQFKNYLNSIGDSIVLVEDEAAIKVHVHSDNPGLVLEKALTAGALSNIKIDNMRQQHRNLIDFNKNDGMQPASIPEPTILPFELVQSKPALHQQIGIIAVSPGEGLADIFRDLGVDYVIEGGQTMNPSADDFVQAARSIDKDAIIILPNNKNIVLAAQQAVKLLADEKQVEVVPSSSAPQGIAALSNCEIGLPFEELAENMCQNLNFVKTGLLTDAVRDTVYKGLEIHTGDALGLIDDAITFVAKKKNDAAIQLIDSLANDAELLTIYYGKDISFKDAQAMQAYAMQNTECEVELHSGGQPVYDYIFSAE